MSQRKELERMIGLLNEKVFSYPQSLTLDIKPRKDLGGVLAFLVLKDEQSVAWVPPVTVCWGGGSDADSACEIILKKFKAGSDLVMKYFPFTAGSAAELELKLAVFGKEGRPA